MIVISHFRNNLKSFFCSMFKLQFFLKNIYRVKFKIAYIENILIIEEKPAWL